MLINTEKIMAASVLNLFRYITSDNGGVMSPEAHF